MSSEDRGVQVEALDCAPDCDERDTCTEVGKVGHSWCGHCDLHDQPRHHCMADCLIGGAR